MQENDQEEDEHEVRRSQQVKTPVIRYGFDDFADLALRATEIDEPTNIEEAFKGSYSKQWRTAADAQSLIENNTWELGCKWVF